jgi:hypothetical protein
LGFIPRGLRRIRHTGESQYPEKQNGFPRIKYGAGSIKHAMPVKEISDTPQLAAGQVIIFISTPIFHHCSTPLLRMLKRKSGVENHVRQS